MGGVGKIREITISKVPRISFNGSVSRIVQIRVELSSIADHFMLSSQSTLSALIDSANFYIA